MPSDHMLICLYHEKDLEIRLKDKRENKVLDPHLKKIFMMDKLSHNLTELNLQISISYHGH